jgi:major type 1 subunit fimbrin (pilin)
MKNMKIASAIAFVLGIAVAGSSMAADGGTITFTGSVTDQTCTIKGGSGTDGGTNNFTVALDAAPVSSLAAAGDTAMPKPFSVNIGGEAGDTTCAANTIAHLSFQVASPRIDASTGALTNALTGEATNTEVQLTDSSGKAINLADPTNNTDVTIPASGPGIINYQAQYLAVGGAATAGLVSTSVVYGVTYN